MMGTKTELKIRLRNELYQRYEAFSRHIGVSIPSLVSSLALSKFYREFDRNANLIDETTKERIRRHPKKSEIGFAPPLTLSIADPLYTFLKDTAAICDVPVHIAIKNIIEMYRAEVKLK